MAKFKNRTEIKAEREKILQKTNLKWKRKNIFGMPYSERLKDDYVKLKAELHALGYTIDKSHMHSAGNLVGFSFRNVEDFGSWYVEMNPKDYKSIMATFFEWIDENFEIGDNYTGSKEWKRE
nr:hypothetical protein [Candidatus Sigynarchaeota archaeon]